MPLPTNKSDQIKVYVLIALGIGGVLYGIWAFVYQPLVQGRLDAEDRREELELRLQGARVAIRRQTTMQEALDESARNLRARAEYDLIHPRLGNYLLHAREIIHQHGRAAGIPGIQVTDLGFTNPPRRPDAESPRRSRAYVARVAAACSYAELIDWLKALEEENPLLAINQLVITAQDGNPLRHQVRFEVQWPVWIDPDTRAVVRELVDAVLTEEDGP